MLFGAFKKFRRAGDNKASPQGPLALLPLPWKTLPLPRPSPNSPSASFPLLFPLGCLNGKKVKNIPFLSQVLKIISLRSGLDPPITLPPTVPPPWPPPVPRVTSQPRGDKLAQSTCSQSISKGASEAQPPTEALPERAFVPTESSFKSRLMTHKGGTALDGTQALPLPHQRSMTPRHRPHPPPVLLGSVPLSVSTYATNI